MLQYIVIISLLIIPLRVFAEPEIKGTPADLAQYLDQLPGKAMIMGEAEIRVPVQRAVVVLRVVTESRSMQEALRMNQDVRVRLTDYLRKRNLPTERILASKFSSTPRFGVFSEKAKSYRVEHLMRIAVQDEAELHGAAGAVDLLEQVQYVGVEFEYADREALKDKALERACENAKQRQRVYEEQFQVELRPVAFTPSEVAAANNQANYATKRSYASGLQEATLQPADLAVAEAPTTSLGELIYTARVTVHYTVHKK
jgi:uncharacterized protein YggE